MANDTTLEKIDPTWDEKRSWLIKHGYITYRFGLEFITAEALAQLGCNAVSTEEISYAAKNNDSAMLFSAIDRLRDGAALMRDIYETDDYVELLYAAFSGRKEGTL